jgi:epoxide hydrolase-like predicted phosphatase
MTIRAIIFDCFGVLTEDLWREFTASLPADEARQARELNHAYDAAMISKQEFLQQVYAVTGRHPDQVEALLDTETHKNIELLSYIDTLKPTYKIGMLSNIATPWIRDKFLTAAEQKLFDDMVFSFEVGMTKPDKKIFELACNRLQVLPAETIFVDDVDRNCEAAQELGMKSIIYTDFASMLRQLHTLLV